jgi:hypothetical protein
MSSVNPATSSQQVAWWEVHEHVVRLIAVEDWPLLGTPQWCALADYDPAKMAALLDAGQKWALRLETEQQARADASREVACAVDWPVIAQEIRDRAEFYAARPWLRRVT